MSGNVLNKFGELLMKDVRDKTISHWDMILDGRMKGISGQQVKAKIDSFSDEQIEVLKWLIPKVIDENLHNLLTMVEENETIKVEVWNHHLSGNVKELSDGLAGELYTEDGWISRFSKERYDEF